MSVAIVRFGGSNCDRDAARALDSLDVDADIVWHEDGLPEDVSGVMLPGGFSYGDYLRAGAMAARAPVMADVREAIDDGVPVLGVCNGAQIGCEAGLTPGAFTVNVSARFQCEHVYLRVENADTPWTATYEEGDVLEIPIAHGEGRYVADEETLETLDAEDRVLFRYCDADGNVTAEANPNGSADNVAGLVSRDGQVAVMMPHPERASLPDIGGTDGRGVLRGFV
ncbi:phosphoribosylformylglycinamidine synthase I [Halospeciosus flavus]|uniref:Phosphoribosylformylglycinamidine synthase subunit PurQ n=1 Tax=Halospeciosus flavus TaxID=3032283 RepID=A0ABD5Z8B2_9EURY|nr:phosphoribosylformylglycinamidine synthase I [Halospeciosus flavus]